MRGALGAESVHDLHVFRLGGFKKAAVGGRKTAGRNGSFSEG